MWSTSERGNLPTRKAQTTGRQSVASIARSTDESATAVGANEKQGNFEESQIMLEIMMELRQIEQVILATGKVDSHELEALRKQIYAGGKIDRRGADFLVELHKRVQHLNPAFEQFFYQAIKDHILAQGRIDAEEAAWLRRMLFADGKVEDEERKFLHELKGEAQQVSREFEVLIEESMKQPPEQRTCG
jgi:hypothetical protein